MANPIPMVRKVTAGTLTFGEAQSAVAFANCTSAEDSANSMTVDFTGVITVAIDFAVTTLMNSSGLSRPATTTWSGVVVTVAEGSLATTDQVIIVAYATPLI